MATTTKRVRKSTPAKKKPATRRRAAPKRSAPKAPRSKKAAKKPARRRTPIKGRTSVTALAELLPEPVGDNTYVSRTLTILEQDQRRRARSRATRARQLQQVAADVRQELMLRVTGVEVAAAQTFEGLADRVRAIDVVQQAIALPEQVTGQMTDAVDGVLDRVGLMRKATHLEALASRPARRRAA